MLTVVAGICAYTVLLVLVLAVVERVRAPRELPAALVAHRVLPRWAVGPVAAAVTVVEVGLVAALAIGPHPLALLGAALLFAAYGGYSARVAGGPCGCGGVEVPMDGWVTGRALVLAGSAAFAAVAADPVPPLSRLGSPPLLVIPLAAATFGLLLWHLPAAMRDPARPEVVR